MVRMTDLLKKAKEKLRAKEEQPSVEKKEAPQPVGFTCFVIGFVEAGEEGLLWVMMGWMLRIEFILQKHREEVEEDE